VARKTAHDPESAALKKEIISDYVRLTLKEETRPGEVYRKLRRKIGTPKKKD
jgi:hypothetical protein